MKDNFILELIQKHSPIIYKENEMILYYDLVESLMNNIMKTLQKYSNSCYQGEFMIRNTNIEKIAKEILNN